MSNFTVIRDTREKHGQGWFFKPQEKCVGTEVSKLDTGDYTIKGYENLFIIERKGKLSEFAQNVLQDRFWRELVRMDSIAHAFLILEFTLDDLLRYPYDMPDPRKIKLNGKFLLMKLNEIQMQFKTKVMFVGDKGPSVAMSLFKRVIDQYGAPS